MSPLSRYTKEELDLIYKSWARLLTRRNLSKQNKDLAHALVRDMKAHLERDIGG